MKDLIINIPNPCHENWDKMVPADQGRYCISCAKTVVDFSQMSTPEIQNFFKKQKEDKICGHFKSSQLDEKLSRWKKSLISLYEQIENKFSGNILKTAALVSLALLMNLSGCQSHKHTLKRGKVKTNPPDNKKKYMLQGEVISQPEPKKP